jgi:hypothetical protein
MRLSLGAEWVRLAWQIAELRAALDKIAVANAAMAAALN